MNREVKLKELQLLDAARRKFLHFQKQQREAELKRLDDEVQRKVSNSLSIDVYVYSSLKIPHLILMVLIFFTYLGFVERPRNRDCFRGSRNKEPRTSASEENV